MLEKNWRDLIKPRALDVEKETATPFYSQFTLKPLERGFGLTLGNALRRVLLSSLQGAAVTAVKIDGVVHEFAGIAEVKEDVAEILLNLKEVRFRLNQAEQVHLHLEFSGEGIVKASHIQLNHQVEILNPEQILMTMGKKGSVHMELKVGRGRGYRTAEQNKGEDLAVGWLPVDSFFSPVRRVNYTVTQCRVGQRTDYDQLRMQVWTDGSVVPEDAFSLAAKILKDQLSVCLNFEEAPESVLVPKEQMNVQTNPNLYRSVEELELSVRSANCLHMAGIKYIYELVVKTQSEMLKTKNFGRKSLNEIEDILKEMGLSLGMKLEGNFAVPEGSQALAGQARSLEEEDFEEEEDSEEEETETESQDDDHQNGRTKI